MDFLRMLEGIRTPVLDGFMSVVTYLGSEILFMALAVLVFWCVSKKQGYYLFAVGLAGVVINQFLKLWFRIPRPWVLDPNFSIVESARAEATGYSFPSGHTQNIVGTLGVIAVSNRQKWVRVLCIVFILLVPFSRMYLGVHTPLDVCVSFGVALLLIALFYPTFKNNETFAKRMPLLLALLVGMAVAYTLFVLSYSFPADVDEANLQSGIHNAFTMTGAMLGLVVSYIFDRKVLNFKTKAPFVGQALKLVLGLGLVVALRAVLKAPLLALFNGSEVASLVRYFIMVVFAGCVWPATFPFFARIGSKKEAC